MNQSQKNMKIQIFLRVFVFFLFSFFASFGCNGWQIIKDISLSGSGGSDDATLSTLSTSEGTLVPTFSPEVLDYQANVPNMVAFTTLTAEANHAGASVSISSTSGDSDSSEAGYQAGLIVGENTITILVRAEDGETTLTYTVEIRRAPMGALAEADLRELELVGVTLSPAFAMTTTSYTAEAANSMMSVVVRALPVDGKATVSITPPDADTGTNGHQVNLPLSPSTSTITVLVTAEDATTTKTYTITASRLNTTLASLSLSGTTLSPAFDPMTTMYTASNVAQTVSSVNVTASPSESSASVSISSDRGASGNTADLWVGFNDIRVMVNLGSVTQTYTVRLTRLAGGADRTLREFTISDGTLSPAFVPNSSTTNYSATIPFSTGIAQFAATCITVVLTPSHTSANINNFSDDHPLPGRQFCITSSNRTITFGINVGGGQRDYNFTLNRNAARTDATLISLTLAEGRLGLTPITLNPLFARLTASYTAMVGNSVSVVTVAATPNDPLSRDNTITPADADPLTPGHQVDLTVGSNSIRVRVFAEALGTNMDYNITVNRMGTGGPCPTCPVIIWLSTNNMLNGNLGGLTGADTICQGDTPKHALLPGGRTYTHRAKLFDSVRTTLPIPNQGAREARSITGTLVKMIYSNIPVDQMSGELDPDRGLEFWSGFKDNVTYCATPGMDCHLQGSLATDNCSGWTTTSGTGRIGTTATIISTPSSASLCTSMRSILCVSY